MCIIIVKPQGAQLPPFEIISRCAKRNPDGFGFAVPGRVFKSMSFKRFYKELQSVAKSEVPAVIHFRFATHGSIRLANCHPFRDENTGVSFAHNGVLSLVPDGDMTDSETAFRNVLLPEIENSGINSGKFKTAVSNVIGGSRFAFITDKGNIKMFGNYVRYSDCFYSNLNFI